jgi:hypothetical protein
MTNGALPFLANRIGRNLLRFGKVSPAFTPEEVMTAFRSLFVARADEVIE